MLPDRFLALASTAVLLAVMVPTPTTVAAQAGGCPWCVTPTTCSLVDEDTPLEGCAVAQGHGCMPIPGEGCEIDMAMADHAALSDLLGEYGITFNGVRTASVLELEFPVVAVGTHTPADVCGWYFMDGCAFLWHKVEGPSGSGVVGLHSDCRICITGEGYFDCHPSCEPQDDEETQLAYAEAMQALQVSDRLTLVRLASIIPDYVTYNHERGAVQVLDCERNHVLGSVSVAAN